MTTRAQARIRGRWALVLLFATGLASCRRDGDGAIGVVRDPLTVGPDFAVGSSPPANNPFEPAVGFNGTNYLVVRGDRRTTPEGLYGSRVTPGGAVLDPGGIPISTTPNGHVVPRVSSNGNDYLVVWNDNSSPPHSFAARVSAAGVVLDPAGILLSSNPSDQVGPRAAFDGTNYLVV